jgi:hypothetical protein
MARGIMGWAAMLMVGVFALPAVAQNSQAKGDGGAAPKGSASIKVTNSGTDIEIFVAKFLKKTLQLEPSLELVNDDPENLRLRIPIGADAKQGTPRMLNVIDAAVVARDKAGNDVSQTITIAATADLSFTEDQIPKMLQWANAWNARMIRSGFSFLTNGFTPPYPSWARQPNLHRPTASSAVSSASSAPSQPSFSI